MRDGELSRDGKFKWSAGWKIWIPTGREIADYWHPWDMSPNQVLGAAALVPIRHGRYCTCARCLTAGQRYLDYARNKELWGNGGL